MRAEPPTTAQPPAARVSVDAASVPDAAGESAAVGGTGAADRTGAAGRTSAAGGSAAVDPARPARATGAPAMGAGDDPPSWALLPEILQRRAALDPSRRAYVFIDEHGTETAVLSYGDLHTRALATAAELARCCAPGDRALLIFPPGLEFIVGFFACLYARVIAVPLNLPRRSGPTAAGVIARDCAPSAALTTGATLADARAALEPAPGPGTSAAIPPESTGPASGGLVPAGLASDGLAPTGLASQGLGPAESGVSGLESVLDDLGGRALRWLTVDEPSGERAGPVAAAFRPLPAAPEEIAFLQYTSGSTADPKGVMVSHGNLRANERMIRDAFGHDADSTVVGWAPFFHDQGLIGNVLQPLHAGATSVLMSPLTFARWPLSWLSAISKYRAHTSGGPNFAFDACVARAARADLRGLDLSSWRVAFNGAEPIRAETLRRFAEAFAPYGFRPDALYPCYGLAEATLLVTGSRKGRGPRTLTVDPGELGRERYTPAAGDQGQLLAGSGLTVPPADVRIVDDATGLPCAPDRVGEIWVSGPHVAQGYWGRPDATEATFGGRLADDPDRRYLRTGDLGFIADGELYVVGRIKDLVIIRGRNYYPQDIEDTVASSHPALRPVGCAAFSVSATGGGEQLVVIQEVKPGEATRAGADDIVGAIRAAVIREHQVTIGNLMLTLPGQLQKTSSGKIMRSAARKRYLEAGFREWSA
ncbi:MAG TPA: AMP-binding protein [Trebonia sp.]